MHLDNNDAETMDDFDLEAGIRMQSTEADKGEISSTDPPHPANPPLMTHTEVTETEGDETETDNNDMTDDDAERISREFSTLFGPSAPSSDTNSRKVSNASSQESPRTSAVNKFKGAISTVIADNQLSSAMAEDNQSSSAVADNQQKISFSSSCTPGTLSSRTSSGSNEGTPSNPGSRRFEKSVLAVMAKAKMKKSISKKRTSDESEKRAVVESERRATMKHMQSSKKLTQKSFLESSERRGRDFELFMKQNSTAKTFENGSRNSSFNALDALFCSSADGKPDVYFIASTLRSNFLFLSLDDEKILTLAESFEEAKYFEGETIIEQGDCDEKNMHFYIVAQGQCRVKKDGKLLPGPYGTLPQGAVFGELSVLFGQPRAASILAVGDDSGVTTCYRLDSAVFRDILGGMELEELRAMLAQIDNVINWCSGVNKENKKGKIIRGYKPDRTWLWKQWAGTMLQNTWKQVIGYMVFTAIMGVIVQFSGQNDDTQIRLGLAPESDQIFVQNLIVFGGTWGYLQTLVTFLLTFFLSEAFSFWKTFYVEMRNIQSRLYDIAVIMAGCATRRKTDGKLTPGALKAMGDVTHLLQIFHLFSWVSLKRSFNVLLTPQGLSRMQSRGLITKDEYESMLQLASRNVLLHDASLTWMTTRIMLASERGDISAHDATMEVLLNKVTALGCSRSNLSDSYDGRMPLAYVHFVQLLVDVFTVCAPFTLVARSGYWAIMSVGILTLFYVGLLNLAKMFLDPINNDELHHKMSEHSPNFDVCVLLRETNAATKMFEDASMALPKNMFCPTTNKIPFDDNDSDSSEDFRITSTPSTLRRRSTFKIVGMDGQAITVTADDE